MHIIYLDFNKYYFYINFECYQKKLYKQLTIKGFIII